MEIHMTEIQINNSGSYTVKIGSGLLDTLGEEIRGLGKADKVCIVTDNCVDPLYGKRVSDNLKAAGFDVSLFVFPYGERSKNLSVYRNLQEDLCECRYSRSDMIVAL